MRTYLWVAFVAHAITILGFCIVIPLSKYPRIQEYSVGWDLFKLLVSCGFAVWCGLLLFD